MGKMFKRALATVMVVLIMLTSAPLQGFVELEWPEIDLPDFSEWFSSEVSAIKEIPASGKCGENLSYTFDSSTGELVISGTGYWTYYAAGSSPFYNSEVKKVIINEGVIEIGPNIFGRCTLLESVSIPNSVKCIDTNAFFGCNALESIIIPDGVECIYVGAFSYCHNLKYVTFGKNLEILANNCFAGCENLENFSLPNNLKSIASGAFSGCEKITEVIIPDSVTYIGYAFTSCNNLEHVYIGKNVEKIDGNVFRESKKLSFIKVNDENEFYSNDYIGVLFDKSKTEVIAFPAGNANTVYSIPQSVIKIGSEAFSYSENLESITIPCSVKIIDKSAFFWCSSLKIVSIPDNVETIEEMTFFNCTNLKSVILGNGVITIYEEAFRSCKNLERVFIGKKLSSIQWASFSYCDKLTNVYYVGTKEDIDEINIKEDNDYFNNAKKHFNVTISNGHAYQCVDGGLNWNDAKIACESVGGHLATVTSKRENDILTSLLSTGKRNAYWLGAQKNNVFEWVTGEKFAYDNWANGEPDNYGGNENHIMIYRDSNEIKGNKSGEWNDLNAGGSFGKDSFFGLDNIGCICEWGDFEYSYQEPVKIFNEKSYIADIWLDKHSKVKNTPESSLINSMTSYSSSSAEIYDDLKSDENFQNSLRTWNGLKVMFNSVQAIKEKVTKSEIYETLVLDLIRKAMAEKEKEIKNVILDAVDVNGNLASNVTKYKQTIDDVAGISKFTTQGLLESLKTFKFDPDGELFQKFYESLNNVNDRATVWTNSKYVKGVGEIASVSESVSDFYERLTGYCIAVDMAEEMVVYLKQMRKSASDENFITALDNIIYAYKNSDFAALFSGGKLIEGITFKVINGCFEDIAKQIPIYNKLKAVYDAGVNFVNLTLNTSELIDCYHLCEATKNFMDASKSAVVALAEQYKNSNYEKDAGAYVYAIRNYKNVVGIDLETAVKTVKAATEDGLVNYDKKIKKSIVSFVTGSKEESTYEKAINAKNAIIDSFENNLWFLDNSWKFDQSYLKEDCPEIFEIYIRDEIYNDRYKPNIHSVYINKNGESVIDWSNPTIFYCQNEKGEEIVRTLPAYTSINGIRLEEQIADYNNSEDIPIEQAENPLIRSYDAKYVTVFPKNYILSSFVKTVNGNQYSRENQCFLPNPLRKVQLFLPTIRESLGGYGSAGEFKFGKTIAIRDYTISRYDDLIYEVYCQEKDSSEWMLIDTVKRSRLAERKDVTLFTDERILNTGNLRKYKVRSSYTFIDGTKITSDFSDVFSFEASDEQKKNSMQIYSRAFTNFSPNSRAVVQSEQKSEGYAMNPHISLDWEPMTGASKYEIYRAASYEQTYSLIGEVDEEVTEYKDYNARNRTTYDYLVLPVKISNGERIYDASICAQGQILYDLGDTYTVTWNMGGMKHVQNYVVGEPLKEPEIYAVKYKKFIGWDKAVPDSMVGENLEFTAIYEDDHVHDYDSMIIDEPTCTSEGRRGFACDCGDDYTEATAKAAHQFTEKIIDSAHLKSAATTSSAAVYKYDCANCDAISDTLTFKHGNPLPSLGKTSKISVTQTTTSIKLSWNKVSNATIYRIYVKQSGEWKTLGDTTALSVTYTKLKPGTIYTYAVKAGKKVGNKIEWASAYTSIKTATKPDATTGLKVASQSETEIKLSWKAVSGASGYRIYSYNTKTKKYESVGYIPGKTAFTVKNLKARTSYKFKVRAYINTDLGAVWGGYTGELVTSTIPGKVSGFKASQNTSEIKLTWKAVSGAVDYRIYQYKPSTGKYYYLATATGKSTSHILRKLKIGTKYMFAFKVAVTLNGKKVYSEYSDVFTTSTKPAKTTGIKVSSQTATSINLTWKAVAGADGYRLYKYDAKKKVYTSIGYVAGKTSFKVNKLKMNETNKFKIRAYINTSLNPKAVWGEYSEILTYKIAPTLTVSSKAKGKATLLWSQINGVDGYEVFYSFSGKSNSYKKLTDCNKNVKGLNLSLTSGGKYYFLVRAYIMNGKTRIYSGYNIVSVKVK